MKLTHRASLLLAPLAVIAVLTLIGCSSSSQPAASGAANSAETAQAYADCLTGEGIKGAFVGEDGFVGVSVESKPGGSTEAGDTGDSTFFLDADPGSAFAEAEATCVARVPDYHAQVFDDDPVLTAQILAQSRAFAVCARQNGLADFPDPDAATGGKLLVPDGTTKVAFLAVVTACASTFAPADGGTDTDAGATSDTGDGQTFTVTMPQFGGAYDKSWAQEVTSLVFAALEPVAGEQQ